MQKSNKESSQEKILEKSSIEELAIGTYMNFNFFHTPISDQVDFIGIETKIANKHP